MFTQEADKPRRYAQYGDERWTRDGCTHPDGSRVTDEKAALCLCKLERLGQNEPYGRSVTD